MLPLENWPPNIAASLETELVIPCFSAVAAVFSPPIQPPDIPTLPAEVEVKLETSASVTGDDSPKAEVAKLPRSMSDPSKPSRDEELECNARAVGPLVSPAEECVRLPELLASDERKLLLRGTCTRKVAAGGAKSPD